MGQRSESALLSQKRLCAIATNQLRAREDLHHRRNKRSKRVVPVAAKHLFRLFLEPASNLHASRQTPYILGQTSQSPGPCASDPRPPEFIGATQLPCRSQHDQTGNLSVDRKLTH